MVTPLAPSLSIPLPRLHLPSLRYSHPSIHWTLALWESDVNFRLTAHHFFLDVHLSPQNDMPKIGLIFFSKPILVLTLAIQWIASIPSWSWLRIFDSSLATLWVCDVPDLGIFCFSVSRLLTRSLERPCVRGSRWTSSKPGRKVPCGGLITSVHPPSLLDRVTSASHSAMAFSGSRPIRGTSCHQLRWRVPELT